MREDEGQGSLFGGEALAPPAPTPTPFPRRERPSAPTLPREAPDAGEERSPQALDAGEVRSPQALDAGQERAPHAPDAAVERAAQTLGAPLAGPTLDDAMSRAWEGLVAGVPAACPVCHAEIEPVLGRALVGHCSACDITLD
jgi:hypothetical protein